MNTPSKKDQLFCGVGLEQEQMLLRYRKGPTQSSTFLFTALKPVRECYGYDSKRRWVGHIETEKKKGQINVYVQ